jgi:sarcosine oxidase subunit beta
MNKTVVCPCEDVTANDLREAVRLGYRDIESVKRYTGFGTGFCQGKSCLTHVAAYLKESGAASAEQLGPFTARPPFRPTEFAFYAGIDPESVRGIAGAPAGAIDEDSPFHAHRPTEPLPARCAVAIVGGGIMGLALAYNLCKRGQRDVVVLEGGYLCNGASGRNGGGIRAQWNTQTNIRLAKRGMQLFEGFARELGLNVWFRRGGYLFLARDAETAARLERSADFHALHGLRTQLMTADGARDLVPDLDTRHIAAAAFNPDDGVIFPWPLVWGYARGVQKLGGQVHTFTRVLSIDVDGGRVRAVQTDRGPLACDVLVNAAGAWSPQIAALAGVVLPNVPQRHEICSSEPQKPFLGPLVSVLDEGIYFSQSLRGELVGGMGDPSDPPGLNQTSSLRFLARYSQGLLRCLPRLGALKVVRQWAGCYDVTPDNSPVLGETPGLSGFLQMSGFVGHGFMMAPAVAELMAQWMAGGERDEIFDRFSLSRFAEGRLEREDFIIG